MFENVGEIVVLGLAVMMTWSVTWGVAEWRAVRIERSVAGLIGSADAPPSDTHAGELASVRILAQPPMRRSA